MATLDFENGTKGINAFTLVEILVAITMIAVIMATVFGTFTGVLSNTRDAEKKAELYQIGRAVMDLLCADLRGFMPVSVPERGVFFLGSTEPVEGDKEMSRADFITTHALSFGIDRSPFLSEVGYRVKRSPEGGLYSLWRRAEQPPEYPFEEGGREVPICKILESFRLEFMHNNDKEKSLFYAIPDAIFLSFTLNLEGHREHFVTMVRPMVGGGPSL
jgi:hypothetical protein